jgi:hypothetical protein
VSSAGRPIHRGRKIGRAADPKIAPAADDAGAAASYGHGASNRKGATQMNDPTRSRLPALRRLISLSGFAFAVSTAVGFLLMGKNPEPDAPIAAITRYWQTHHAHVSSAAIVLAYGGVLFALFGASIWSRLRRSAAHPLVGTAALLGTAVAAVGLLASAMTYFALGDLAAKPTALPATLQTLHVLGSELSYPIAGGLELLLLAVAAAGIATRAFPRWLAWSALPIGLLQLTTIGFTAFLLFLLWSAAASIALVAETAASEAAWAVTQTTSLAESR